MIDTLITIYLVGLAIYTLLQLVCGNFGGVARITVKRLDRTFYIPSMYGAAGLCLLWFIALPIQIHQYRMERVQFYRARAKRRAEYDADLIINRSRPRVDECSTCHSATCKD